MIIFLYGRDGYRLKQNVQKIIDEYRKKNASGLSLTVLDFSEEPAKKVSEFEDAVKTVSFFDEKRLIQLNEASPVGEQVIKVVKERGLDSDKSTILVFVENLSETELAKKSKKYFAYLSAEKNLAKPFEPLSGKQLDAWIGKEAETAGIKIEPFIGRKLSEKIGNDSWALKQEIDKLANYCLASGKKAVTSAELELLVTGKINLNIFEAIDAMASRNRGRAMVLLNKHLTNGEDPYYLFSMVVYQFRNLLRVKSLADSNGSVVLSGDAVAKKTGMHPFAARKMLEQSRKYQLEELKQKFTALADADVAIKNGEVDIVDCLYQIVLG